MLQKIFVIIAFCVALIAIDVSRLRVPLEAKDTLPVRRFMYERRLREIKSTIYGFLWGYDAKYSSWVEITRSQYTPKPTRIEDGLKISDTTFGQVPVRVYEPLTKEPNGGAIVWIHGGGWIVGSVDGSDGKCRYLAINANMITVCVAYRLAPEYPYPIPLQDCEEATMYLLRHAAEYDVNPERIAIGGASAGGTLSAAVSLKLRDRKVIPSLKLQVLLYPVLQPLDFNLPSYLENKDDPVLPRERMIAMWLLYARGNVSYLENAMNNNSHVTKEIKSKTMSMLNHDVITGRTGSTPQPTDGKPEVWDQLRDVFLDPYFAPLLAEDLSGLPQALVYTVEQDVLRDEGILYAHRLKGAGNIVYHLHNKAAFHGLNSVGLNILNSTEARESEEKLIKFIKENL